MLVYCVFTHTKINIHNTNTRTQIYVAQIHEYKHTSNTSQTRVSVYCKLTQTKVNIHHTNNKNQKMSRINTDIPQTHIYTYAHTHTHRQTDAHTHIRTHTHTHTHTLEQIMRAFKQKYARIHSLPHS